MRQMVADILGLHFDNPEEITENPMPMVKPFEDNNQELPYYIIVPMDQKRGSIISILTAAAQVKSIPRLPRTAPILYLPSSNPMASS